MPCGFPPAPSFWQKVWYFLCIAVMSVGYFFYAVAVGLWEWGKDILGRGR